MDPIPGWHLPSPARFSRWFKVKIRGPGGKAQLSSPLPPPAPGPSKAAPPPGGGRRETRPWFSSSSTRISWRLAGTPAEGRDQAGPSSHVIRCCSSKDHSLRTSGFEAVHSVLRNPASEGGTAPPSLWEPERLLSGTSGSPSLEWAAWRHLLHRVIRTEVTVLKMS